MTRAILTPDTTSINLSIPQDYVGKQLEITILPIEEMESKSRKTLDNFWGVLSEKTARILHEDVRASRDNVK